MTQTKSYKGPYGSIIILTALVAAYYILIFIFYSRSVLLPREELLQLVVPGIIVVLVLSAEAVVYWYLRKRIRRRIWAVMHIVFLYFSLVIVPLLHGVYIFFASYSATMEDYPRFVSLARISQVLVWSGIASAHIFFIALLVNGLVKRNESSGSNEAEQGLFDDIVA